jgi:hypothetical protein
LTCRGDPDYFHLYLELKLLITDFPLFSVKREIYAITLDFRRRRSRKRDFGANYVDAGGVA